MLSLAVASQKRVIWEKKERRESQKHKLILAFWLIFPPPLEFVDNFCGKIAQGNNNVELSRRRLKFVFACLTSFFKLILTLIT